MRYLNTQWWDFVCQSSRFAARLIPQTVTRSQLQLNFLLGATTLKSFLQTRLLCIQTSYNTGFTPNPYWTSAFQASQKFVVLLGLTDEGKVVIHRPEDGSRKNLWNVGKLIPDYTEQYSRRQTSSIYILVLMALVCAFSSFLNPVRPQGLRNFPMLEYPRQGFALFPAIGLWRICGSDLQRESRADVHTE
jgi:hypothetical protein